MLQYLKQELTKSRAEIYQAKRGALWAYNGQFIPTQATLVPGEKSIEIYTQDFSGQSKRYNGISNDIPTVNISMSSKSYRVADWVVGAEWNIYQLQQHQLAQSAGLRNLGGFISERVNAMARSISEAINKAVIFGQSDFKGFLSNSDVTTQVEATAPYTLSTFDLYSYLAGVSADFVTESKLSPNQLTLAVPDALYRKLTLVTIVGGIATSAYQLLTDSTFGASFGQIVKISELTFSELEANGVQAVGTNRDRFVVYYNSPETLLRETYPVKMTEPLPTPDGLHFAVSAYQGSTEVQVREPLYIKYFSIAKP